MINSSLGVLLDTHHKRLDGNKYLVVHKRMMPLTLEIGPHQKLKWAVRWSVKMDADGTCEFFHRHMIVDKIIYSEPLPMQIIIEADWEVNVFGWVIDNDSGEGLLNVSNDFTYPLSNIVREYIIQRVKTIGIRNHIVN